MVIDSVAVATRYGGRAPLTAREYARRVKTFDRNVLVGGTIFGVDRDLSGMCPGAAYASLGIDNYPICGASRGCSSESTLRGPCVPLAPPPKAGRKSSLTDR